MVQCHTVEFLKRIRDLSTRSRKSRVHRDALHLARAVSANIDTCAFFHVAEVARVDPTALMRDHWRLHMTDQSPLGLSEEGVCLDI